MGKTILFLDAENMSSVNVARAVAFLKNKYLPSEKIIAMAAKSISHALRPVVSDFQILRCKPGRNAADHVIQEHMITAASDSTVERVILFTNDHGFRAACDAVIEAGKKLIVAVSMAKRLVRGFLFGECGENVEVFNVNDQFSDGGRSVFFRTPKGRICEVPFRNGMPLNAFVHLLKKRGVWRKNITKYFAENFLTLVGGNFVFVDVERVLA